VSEKKESQVKRGGEGEGARRQRQRRQGVAIGIRFIGEVGFMRKFKITVVGTPWQVLVSIRQLSYIEDIARCYKIKVKFVCPPR